MPRPNPFTAEQEAEIIRLYASWTSTHSIANAMNTWRTNITRRIKDAGINLRARKERCPGLAIRHDAFSSVPLEPEAAYWIGFLMADGYVSCKGKYGTEYVSLCLSRCDHDHVVLFKKFLGSDHKLIYKSARDHDGISTKATVTLTFSSTQIANDLASYGVTPQKSFTAKVSEALENDRDFWRGVIDGDGSLGIYRRGQYKPRPLIQMAGSPFLVRQFAAFASAFGTAAKPVLAKGLWRLAVWCSPAIRLIRHLYEGSCRSLSRKQAIAMEILQLL